MSEGCGLRLAIRAKSSTNPAGRGQGLRFQRGDLEEKHEVKFQSDIHVTSQNLMSRANPWHMTKQSCIGDWKLKCKRIFYLVINSNQVCMYTDLQHQRTLTRTRRAWVHPGKPWARALRPRRWACRCDGHILPARRTSPPPCCWWVLSVQPKRRKREEKKMAVRSVPVVLVSKVEINVLAYMIPVVCPAHVR